MFGIVAWTWPDLTLGTLVWLAGFWLVFDGIVMIVGTIADRDRYDRIWPSILLGIAGIIFGIVIMAWPGISVVALMITIGIYAVVSGILGAVEAIRLRKEIEGEWWLVGLGVLTAVFGAAIILFPGAGAVSLIWVIAIYAIVIGVAEIIFAFRIRKQGSAS